MLHLLCKWKWKTLIKSGGDYSPTLFCLAPHNIQSLKAICSSSSSNITTSANQDNTFTVSDLIKECKFTVKSRINYASIIARLESSKRPNSVLEFFQSRGLSQDQVKGIISQFPPILLADVEKIIRPKMNFLLSVGFSEADLNEIITTDPSALYRSLKNHLIPLFDVLKTVVGSEQNAVTTIKRNPLILYTNLSRYLVQNVSTLRNFGVPESRILKFITREPNVIAKRLDCFNKVVSTVKEMGFDPSSSAFVRAVAAIARVSESKWNGKLENYRSLGFSDEEILSMFKKQPQCMISSEEKMRETVEFCVNRLHWSPSWLSMRPNVLCYSLEKRIVPRCSVLQILVSKNRIHSSMMLTTLLVIPEKDFVRRYVTTYMQEVPEVLAAYKALSFNFCPFWNSMVMLQSVLGLLFGGVSLPAAKCKWLGKQAYKYKPYLSLHGVKEIERSFMMMRCFRSQSWKYILFEN